MSLFEFPLLDNAQKVIDSQAQQLIFWAKNNKEKPNTADIYDRKAADLETLKLAINTAYSTLAHIQGENKYLFEELGYYKAQYAFLFEANKRLKLAYDNVVNRAILRENIKRIYLNDYAELRNNTACFFADEKTKYNAEKEAIRLLSIQQAKQELPNLF